MNQIEAIVHALLATMEAQRAQLEALLGAVQSGLAAAQAPAQTAGPLMTCPTCGASGETQQAVRTMSGKTSVFCQTCKTSRVVDGQSTE